MAAVILSIWEVIFLPRLDHKAHNCFSFSLSLGSSNVIRHSFLEFRFPFGFYVSIHSRVQESVHLECQKNTLTQFVCQVGLEPVTSVLIPSRDPLNYHCISRKNYTLTFDSDTVTLFSKDYRKMILSGFRKEINNLYYFNSRTLRKLSDKKKILSREYSEPATFFGLPTG